MRVAPKGGKMLQRGSWVLGNIIPRKMPIDKKIVRRKKGSRVIVIKMRKIPVGV